MQFPTQEEVGGSRLRKKARTCVSDSPDLFRWLCKHDYLLRLAKKETPQATFILIAYPQWLIGFWSFVESGATPVKSSVAIVLARCGKKETVQWGVAHSYVGQTGGVL